jgi:hypothetical protein
LLKRKGRKKIERYLCMLQKTKLFLSFYLHSWHVSCSFIFYVLLLREVVKVMSKLYNTMDHHLYNKKKIVIFIHPYNQKRSMKDQIILSLGSLRLSLINNIHKTITRTSIFLSFLLLVLLACSCAIDSVAIIFSFLTLLCLTNFRVSSLCMHADVLGGEL